MLRAACVLLTLSSMACVPSEDLETVDLEANGKGDSLQPLVLRPDKRVRVTVPADYRITPRTMLTLWPGYNLVSALDELASVYPDRDPRFVPVVRIDAETRQYDTLELVKGSHQLCFSGTASTHGCVGEVALGWILAPDSRSFELSLPPGLSTWLKAHPDSEYSAMSYSVRVYEEEGGHGLGCFVAGTLVQTPAGARPIESLTVGEQVLSYDLVQKKTTPGHISKTWFHPGKAVGVLSLVDGTQLGLTPGHPLFSEEAGRFVEAAALRAGDHVLQLDRDAAGNPSGVAATTVRSSSFSGQADVYNLTVDSHSNYFAAGVLVHNKD